MFAWNSRKFKTNFSQQQNYAKFELHAANCLALFSFLLLLTTFRSCFGVAACSLPLMTLLAQFFQTDAGCRQIVAMTVAMPLCQCQWQQFLVAFLCHHHFLWLFAVSLFTAKQHSNCCYCASSHCCLCHIISVFRIRLLSMK